MSLIWLAAVGFLIWYLVKHQSERPVWPWIGLGVLALPLLHGGMMGGRGGMMGGYGGMMGGYGGMMGGHGGMMGGHGYMMGSALAGPWAWVAMALHALVIVALVVTAVVLVRRFLAARAHANSPLAILQNRLARGEISADEYDLLRSKLQG